MASEPADKVIEYQCGLEMHPEGEFVASDRRYRPFWPRGLPKNYKTERIEEMLGHAVRALERHYSRTPKDPAEVSVIGFDDGTTRIIISENPTFRVVPV